MCDPFIVDPAVFFLRFLERLTYVREYDIGHVPKGTGRGFAANGYDRAHLGAYLAGEAYLTKEAPTLRRLQ